MSTSSLRTLADTLETYAGATTSANADEAGYWKRIAAAAEALAGASTSANPNVRGYQRRAAIALDTHYGTPSDDYEMNEAGYIRSMAAAFATRSGTLPEGSALHQLSWAAANVPLRGPELIPSATTGAAVGSPGTLPSTWRGAASGSGLSREVSAVTASYVDLRLAGTSNLTYFDFISSFQPLPFQAVAANEQYELIGAEAAVLAGALPGPITYHAQFLLNDAFVSQVAELDPTYLFTIPASGVNQIRILYLLNMPDATSVDVTLRIQPPSLKKVLAP